MKLKAIILTLAVAIASPALAQNTQLHAGGAPYQQPAPEVEALSAKLMQEISASVSCSAGMVSASREIGRLQAKIKELEAKPAEGSKEAR